MRGDSSASGLDFVSHGGGGQLDKVVEGAKFNRRSDIGILARGFPDSKSAARQRLLRARTLAAYTRRFREAPRYQRMVKIEAAAASAHFRQMHS